MGILSEQEMKIKGESRVWKDIFSKTGATKSVSQTQLGQQLIMTEAIRLMPIMKHWIEEGCSKLDRKQVKAFFINDDIILKKIVETFLLLSATSHVIKEDPKKVHVRHKNIATINEKILPDLTFNQAWRFTESLIDFSKYFTVESERVSKGGAFLTSVKYICQLPESIMEQLAIKSYGAFFSEPITILPKDWEFKDGELNGGYHHYKFEMVRTRSHKVDYSKYSQKVFDSINYIQSTPWRINKVLMAVLKDDLKKPKKEDFLKSEFPSSEDCKWDIDLSKLEEGDKEIDRLNGHRKIYYDNAELYYAEVKDFESSLGKYRAVRLAIGIAESYKDEEKIYFPHSFDFRGRVYPIPIGLSPQGADAVKAMLEYSNTNKLNERGAMWAWAYLASLYGDDKLLFDKRVERGKELLWVDYKDADEPYQFLAHQLEMRKFSKDSDFEFRGRIHLDACNSGSQFTSAITGDMAGCVATNVIPSFSKDGEQDRQDAYLLVSNKTLGLVRFNIIGSDSQDKDALILFENLLDEKGRKICKKPVMVSNYGGTAGGRATIVFDMLRELKVDRFFINKKNCAIFSKLIGDSIAGVLNGSKAFEGYIQKMNTVITKENKPITWNTSDGFHVVHMKKKELKPISVSCFLPGSRKSTTIIQKKYSEDINAIKMKSAIAPNYVHSLDAELLRRVSLRMQDAGIIDSDFIHDSFGCHPNDVDAMLRLLKEEFADMMINDPLGKLDEELRSQVGDSKESQKAASKVVVPRLGELDHKLVYDSDWFFS
jgi:DNA-directed RNA polymerase